MTLRAIPLAGLLLALGAGSAAGQQSGPPAVVGQQFGPGETAATSSQPVTTLTEPSRTVTVEPGNGEPAPQARNPTTNRAEGEAEGVPRTGPDYESAYEPQDYLTPKPPPGWDRPDATETDGDTRTYERGEMGVGRQFGGPAGNALATPAGRTTVPIDGE